MADAQSFAEELRRQQTQVARFDHVEIIPLLNENATKANFLSALRRLAGAPEPPTLKAGPFDRLKRAEPEDAVIIYFAGHGTAQGQRFYLLPHDLGYTSSGSAPSFSSFLAWSTAGSIECEGLRFTRRQIEPGNSIKLSSS